MKTWFWWVICFLCCLASCEENPDISLERKPIPVVYSVFNKYDSVHYIYLTKTWSGDNGGTLVTAMNKDSIYFPDAKVTVDMIGLNTAVIPMRRDTIHVEPVLEWLHDKKPGIFDFPDYPVYTLNYKLKDIDNLITYISIPGYETFKLKYNLLEIPIINFPHKDGMTISIQPDKGLIIDFRGALVNEVRFFFEIITKSDSGLSSDTIVIKKYMDSGRTTFTYDHFRRGLNQALIYRSDVEYRRFGKTSIEIWTGFGSFPGIETHEISPFNNDYTVPSSPEIPKIFVYGGTVGTNRVVNLELDYLTRWTVANDTLLSRFRFLQW
jgi:hypothetical protein